MRRTIVVVILAVAIAAFAVLQTVFMNNTERAGCDIGRAGGLCIRGKLDRGRQVCRRSL